MLGCGYLQHVQPSKDSRKTKEKKYEKNKRAETETPRRSIQEQTNFMKLKAY